MSGSFDPNQQREFRCNHCSGRILVPISLPPTTGPCPHCSGTIVSPDFLKELSSPAVSFGSIPAPVAPPSAPASPPAVVAESPVAEQAASAPAPAEKAETVASAEVPNTGVASVSAPSKSRRSLIPALIVMMLLVLGAGSGVIYLFNNMGRNAGSLNLSNLPGPSKSGEDDYLRNGWRRDASTVLRSYVSGTSAEEKAPFVLGGDQVAEKLNEFYGGGRIDDADTPAEAFSVFDLSMEDRKRGLFMMIYDQPPQFEMREFFRPLASLDVQYGLVDADLLLSSVARASNFAMESVREHAFFKRTPEGLKLDWDMFAQTKYRTLRNFIEIPNSGSKGVFRVFVVEDVPDQGKSVAGIRTYRIADPANTSDSTRINVKIDSEAGRALSIINWRGNKDGQPQTRTATLELEWVGNDSPQLTVSRFICWEFLGLGGQDASVAKH
jgi:hypothetical protein